MCKLRYLEQIACKPVHQFSCTVFIKEFKIQGLEMLIQVLSYIGLDIYSEPVSQKCYYIIKY